LFPLLRDIVLPWNSLGFINTSKQILSGWEVEGNFRWNAHFISYSVQHTL